MQKKIRGNKEVILITLAICTGIWILAVISFTGFFIFGSELPFLEDELALNGRTWGKLYDELINSFYENGNVSYVVNDSLWVPWFSSSSRCGQADLKSGASCSLGTVNFTQNCMVSDELSQVGILISMGNNQTRMDQFYNTLNNIKSSRGSLPAWRIALINGNIEPCRQGINGNCDTASDATARFIIALFTASNNSFFSDVEQKRKYYEFGEKMSEDFVKYEVDTQCRKSNIGSEICYWLAAGSVVKSSGLGSTDFAYTGYYSDAIIAMLQACTQTGNMVYCAIAGNFTLNYLQASKYDGSFRTPPGRSFKWINVTGTPQAECTSSCSPVEWDDVDAPRVIGICQANYYAEIINYTLPNLTEYCNLWKERYMGTQGRITLQYYPDGSTGKSPQTGYFAQGLESLFRFGINDIDGIRYSIRSAINHYSFSTKTWDYTQCFGIYHQAFAIRSLGNALGRNLNSFSVAGTAANQSVIINNTLSNSTDIQNNTTNSNNSDSSGQNTAGNSGSGGGGSSPNNNPINNKKDPAFLENKIEFLDAKEQMKRKVRAFFLEGQGDSIELVNYLYEYFKELS